MMGTSQLGAQPSDDDEVDKTAAFLESLLFMSGRRRFRFVTNLLSRLGGIHVTSR